MIPAKFEVAFAGSFYDDPATLLWTDLTSRWDDAGGFTAKLGRDSNLAATPQAATCRFALTSNDAALTPGNTASPYFPNIVSGVPVRVSMMDAAGVWQPVFYGLTESWDPSLNGDMPDWSTVDVQCVSAWAYLTAAGSRRTYADRVVGDLAPAKGEAWAAGIRDYGYPVCLYVAGGVYYGGVVPPASTASLNGSQAWPAGFVSTSQCWGFAWLKLENTGNKAWSVPGAGCPVVETGGADTTGRNTTTGALDGGFAGDRPGGRIIMGAPSTISVGAGAGGNYSRAQVFVGRPPTQLAPANVSEPTSTAGWTVTAGTLTLVAASTLSHLPRTTAYDPTTKVTAAPVVEGPVNAMSWVAPGGSQTLRTPTIPVVAGKSYGGLLITTGTVSQVQIEWLNAASGVISMSAPLIQNGGVWGAGEGFLSAPYSAVNARLMVTTGFAETITVGCVGFYEYEPMSGLTPARWWPIGADAKIWAWVQWPDLVTGGMTSGTAGQVRWLHVKIDVTSWDDGQLHMIGWNTNPGVGGKPVVWADNVRVTTGWTVSYPGANVGNNTAHTGDGSAMAGGFGWNAGARVNTNNPSALSVPAALLGAGRYEVTPDDASIARAWSFFGGKKALSATYAEPYVADTGAQMTRALDQLGWPDALRAISAGASTAGSSWTDLSALGDYAALIGDLTKAEYGWVDIGPDGKLVWKPRAWYGVGTAVAVAHYTWRTPTMGKTAYSPPLDVRWDDKDTANSVVVGNGTDTMARSRQDLTAQRRGLRRLEVTLPGGATQTNVDAVADILFAVHAPGPRIESLTLKAFGPDDPMLAQILARRTGDVVLVDLPQLPAPDLTVPMLITSIEHTSDGQTWTAKLGLGVCPIPATFTYVGPAFDGGSLSAAPDAILDGGTLSAAPDLTLDGGVL